MDQGIVDDTYKQENHDMPNTITALRELSGDPLPQSETADIKNDSGKFTFKLQEIRGDLFSCSNSTSLAHCVSVDLKMDKGIAVSFKSKFGGLDELEEQKKQIGDVAILKRGEKFVYYLVTKQCYWQKPTYSDLKKTLVLVRDHCVANNVSNLAMPRIGCGLDGLFWGQVKSYIKDVFF